MGGEVDPRFDPQFQRGYDPGVHRARTPAHPPQPEPAVERVAVERVEAAAPERTAPEVVAASPIAEPDDERARRVPYRLVLLLASIASVAAAVVLVWQRVTADPLDAYYGSNPGMLFRQQLVDALLIPLLVAGLTGVILWLAIGALQGRDDG